MEATLPWKAPRPLPAECVTPRIVLRFWRPEDAASMLAAIDVDRQSLLPWLPWPAVDNRNVSECIYQIEKWRRHGETNDDNFVFGILDRATGDVLGGTGLHRIERESHQAEIGYWMRADRRRQGLCAEAVAHLISWAFRAQDEGGWGLRRIEIVCASKNEPSRRVPQKLGLKQEVVKRQHRFLPGIGWDDTLAWGVLRDEWDPVQGHVRS